MTSKTRIYASAEIERTAYKMTENEIAEARKLIKAWKPGQCARDLSLYPGTDYPIYPDLVSLCKLADSGDFAARDQLGWKYYFGLHGNKPDLPRAYMWYYLATSVHKSATDGELQFSCDAMTPEQRSAAVKYTDGWKPGECEHDLLQ